MLLDIHIDFHPVPLTGFYEQYANWYRWGWSTKQDLQKLVVQVLLPQTEYKRITGEDYVAPQALQPTDQPTA